MLRPIIAALCPVLGQRHPSPPIHIRPSKVPALATTGSACCQPSRLTIIGVSGPDAKCPRPVCWVAAQTDVKSVDQ